MTKSQHDRDLDAMLLADGELPEDEARRVKKSAEADPALRERIEGVREVGELVRTHMEIETDRAAEAGQFAALWARVEQGVNAAPESARARQGRVTPEPGLIRGFAAWWESFHGHVLAGAATAAAVLLLVVAVRPFERVVVKTVAAPPVIALTPAVQKPQPPEVENLEIYEGSGMILTVAGQDGEAPTAVIWLSKDNQAAEGPL